MNLIISVIIPVYNAEKYLRRCLDSIILQSYTLLEIIIVNDGSTDDSQNVCNEYAKKDSRIKFVNQENGGVSKARNSALKIASGDYIHCVDADDWLEDNAYLTLINKISRFNNVDIIKFNAYNSKNTIIGSTPYDKRSEDISIEDISLAYIGSKKFGGLFILGVPWLYMIKRSLIENNHILFNEELHRCEDRLFVITNFLYAKKALFLNFPLYHYETAEDSLSNKYDKRRWEQEKLYLNALEKEYKKIKPLGFIKDANNRLVNDTILRAIISIDNIFFSVNRNNFKDNYLGVKEILTDPLLKDALKNFKSEKLNKKVSIIVKLMKYKQTFLLTLFNTILVYKNKLIN